MDPTRDNPLIRFSTFWWALGTFLIFAILLSVLWLFLKGEPSTPEDSAASTRYETKQKIVEAQAAVISPEALEQAVASTAAALATSKAVAVEKPEQIVPGSPTAEKLAAGGGEGGDMEAINAMTPDADAPIDAAVLEMGKASFLVCSACHGQNGEGGPAGPPLAESEWVTGPVSNLIMIQLRGLTGPITVAGKEYNFPAGMAPMAYQTDEQIAAVLTYVRNNFGNKASAVSPEQVAALRSEVGKPAVTVEELIQP